jgi:hypothetical protein
MMVTGLQRLCGETNMKLRCRRLDGDAVGFKYSVLLLTKQLASNIWPELLGNVVQSC